MKYLKFLLLLAFLYFITSLFGDWLAEDTKEIKEILPEAVYTIKDYVPNEMRDITNYKWRKSKKQYKLTIHDLNNKEPYIKYKFLVKDNEEDEPLVLIKETK